MYIDKTLKFSDFFTKSGEICRKIDFLVLHHVEADSVEHAIAQFQQYQVSSHFLIDESGKIFELVDENDIAYHAGVSFWRGVDGLNATSIGIEFINSAPFSKKFTLAQMHSGVVLCRYLIEKYGIEPENVVGHSDIAYDRETGLLDRKQDPSEMFDWQFLAQNGVGIDLQINSDEKDKILFELADEGLELTEIKKKLSDFGYKVNDFSSEFNLEMQMLARVFNRRFCNKNCDSWNLTSQMVLEKL